MNIKDFHTNEKLVSTLAIFKGEEGKVIALRILKDQILKEHITKVPALLICIEGEAIFENEQGMKETISQGDYINIEAMVKHWVTANVESNFILIK